MKSVDYAKHITTLNRELYDELGIEKAFMAISGITDHDQVMQMVITRMKQGLWNEIMVGKGGRVLDPQRAARYAGPARAAGRRGISALPLAEKKTHPARPGSLRLGAFGSVSRESSIYVSKPGSGTFSSK